VFAVRFRTLGKRLDMRAAVPNSGRWALTPWARMTRGVHRVGVQWSASPLAITLLVDGAAAGSLTGLPAASPLEKVMLGASGGLSLPSRGTLAFDTFSSQRTP
jgi:hypothetical protein